MSGHTTAPDHPERPGDEDPRDDRALLRAHVAGDHEAFGVLVRRHRDRLWAVAMRTMGNREDAADGLQDGLIASYRRAATFRGDAAVSTWLHRVVVNACLDRLRAAKVRRADALPDDLEDRAGRGALVAAATQTDPVSAALEDERRTRILDALATLPAEQRAALVLVDMEGYSVAEAAAILDCPVGTVKSRCSRGRTRLGALLRDLIDAGDDPSAEPAERNRPPTRRVQAADAPRGPPAQVEPTATPIEAAALEPPTTGQ